MKQPEPSNSTNTIAKRSNLRAAIVPVSIAVAFLLGYVAKQVLFK